MNITSNFACHNNARFVALAYLRRSKATKEAVLA